ncbi:MAG: hypothetical protein C0502_08925 [Opitutus sp.]|nr:hypothetical protein [Opitutus sp.]
MTDPLNGAAGAALPAPSDASAPVGAALSGAGEGSALSPGKRWRNYQIGEPDRAHGPGAFHAMDVGLMEGVTLCARPIGPGAEVRRTVWQLLETLPAGNLVPLREAVEDDGWRYEIVAAPSGTSLRDWIACHQIGPSELETVIRQLTLLLEAMHTAGVVHLRVRPDTIFINEAERNLEVCLGGIGVATLHTQADLIPLEVDPYYAPPEAAGLFRHKPGPELCAWDWWSLGRVVQELLLGRHVYGLLFEREVSADPPELRPRAEAALLDRDPSGVRAGAVELLPDNANPRLRTLLRGLLASSRDGRWGSDQVLHWLQREAVPERYDLPRDARLFVWRRQAFTVPEAAEFFLQPDYSIEGQAQLFPGVDATGTLLAFLQELPQLKPELSRLTPMLALVDSAPWQTLPLAARRSAVTGLGWLSLAAASCRPPLSVQRWRVDPAGMQEMFSDAPPAESLVLAQVLTNPAYRRAAEALDAHAGRTLALMAEAGFKALTDAAAAGWLSSEDPVAQTRLLRFSLDSDKDLLARRDRLRMSYATNRDPRLATLLAADKPDRAALVLLAFTGEKAREFGYVTHADWAQSRLDELRARANALAAAQFWERLHRVALAGPALLGPWPVFAALWTAPLAFCLAAESWFAAGGVFALACVLRAASQWWINRLISRYAPGAAPWTWTTRPSRCHEEAARARALLQPPPTRRLATALEAVRKDIRALKLKPAPAQPASAPWLVRLWAGTTLSTVAPLAVVAAMVALAGRVPPMPQLVERPAVVVPEAATPADLAAARLIYEEFNDGFGRRPRGPLKPWDVPAVEPRPLSVRGMAKASAVQRAYAKVGAELLLEPYPRKELEVTIAVPVPTPGEPGLVLYDSWAREIVDPRAFFVPAGLTDRTWYWIGNRRVVYLGVPERLAAQISLAPP